MTADELREEIGIELELIDSIVSEIASLRQDLERREPTIRERTAAAAFLAQFYGGVENILKRIHRYYGFSLPAGDMWHVDLFRRFCHPSLAPLPSLFDESLAAAMAPYRKFRHVVYHSYGFQIDWERMSEGAAKLEEVYGRFKARLSDYLNGIVR